MNKLIDGKTIDEMQIFYIIFIIRNLKYNKINSKKQSKKTCLLHKNVFYGSFVMRIY